MFKCEIFGILFSCEDEDIARCSYLHYNTFNEKWWAILLKKRKIKNFKFEVNLHSFIPHFLFHMLFFRILLQPQVNYQSSFRIFYNLHYESSKKDGLKIRCSLFD